MTGLTSVATNVYLMHRSYNGATFSAVISSWSFTSTLVWAVQVNVDMYEQSLDFSGGKLVATGISGSTYVTLIMNSATGAISHTVATGSTE